MSNSARKSKAHRPPKPEPRPSDSPGPSLLRRARPWLPAVLALVLAGVPFLVGKYIELNSPGMYDSAAYVYSAWQVLQRGSEAWQQAITARPGTLTMNVAGVALFGFSDLGPKVLQGVVQAGALVAAFFALRRMSGRVAAVIGVAIASLALSAPMIAKFGNVKEQYLTAFMMMGVSFLILHQTGRGWWWAALSGAALIWAPTFKPTGISAMVAVALFLPVQPLRKRCTWAQTGKAVGLLAAGAAVGIAPIVLWLSLVGAPAGAYPYRFVLSEVRKLTASRAAAPASRGVRDEGTSDADASPADANRPKAARKSYVGRSWGMIDFDEASARILRYYWVLGLVVIPAAAAILARVALGALRWTQWVSRGDVGRDARFVWLLAVWWLVDGALVWVSPRSYEQYYIPLVGSGAMLGAYAIGRFVHFQRRASRIQGALGAVMGLIGLAVLVVLSLPLVRGVARSPHTGREYPGSGSDDVVRRRGYLQALDRVSAARRSGGVQGQWQRVGREIRKHSEPDDTIFVWGWIPGIYIEAGRTSASDWPFTSEMHTLAPEALARRVKQMIEDFEKARPTFIVDTRKGHFPWDRPPLELWPTVPTAVVTPRPPHRRVRLQTPLPADPRQVRRYERQYAQMLREQIDADEAARFEALAPLRAYLREHYEVVTRPATVLMQTPAGLQRTRVEMLPFEPHVLLRRTRAGEGGAGRRP